MAEKVLPHNTEAEKAVLGSMIRSNSKVSEAVAKLDTEDFFKENTNHRVIFDAMFRLYNRGIPVDMQTLVNELIVSKDLETAGGTEYLVELSDSIVTFENFDNYVKIVQDQSILRRFLSTIEKVSNDYYTKDIDNISDFLAESEKRITEVTEKRRVGDFQRADEVALNLSKEIAKFNETVECHMRLGIEVKHADQQIRSTVVLPAGLGKTVRVCVIAKGPKVNEAKEAGADFYGTEDIIDKISGGWFEFDTLIATPDCMGMLGKLGRVLGPKGLMPNPKTGTVTLDIAKAVKDAKAGKVEFRADKQGMIHCPIGKIQFSHEDLVKNFGTLADAVLRAKPSSAKGTYVKSIYLTTTMGPGIKVDSKNLQAEVKEIVG